MVGAYNGDGTTGFVKGSDTSQNSAQLLDKAGRGDAYDQIILNRLAALGEHGAIVSELCQFMQEQGHTHIHKGSVSGRLSMLHNNGLIACLEEIRLTDANRPAHVYVLPRWGEGRATRPSSAQRKQKTAKEQPSVGQGMTTLSPTIPNRLDLGPVRMEQAEIMDIENWLREKLFRPTGEFSREREVAQSVQKLVRIYKSFIA